MNIKNRTAIVFTLAIILATGIVASSILNFSVYAQNDKFNAKLSGQEEVPPTNSNATGIVELSIAGEDRIEYKVNATNILSVTDGHLHIGEKGENGLIVFTLFRPDAPVDQISENETITEDEFVGSLKGKSMSDLITAMSNGSIYANIHTQDNPNGEIRGQIMSSNP